MKSLMQRWNSLQPREQWLALLVLTSLILMLWSSLGHDPLQRELQRLQQEQQQAQQREQQVRQALATLQARSANQPAVALRKALEQARGERDSLRRQLQRDTARLVSPQQMQRVLRELLPERSSLHLLGLESSTRRIEAPLLATATDALQGAQVAVLYRHGLRLTLEGSYFELRDYLQAVETAAGQLLWEGLDYQVGETGSERARIELEIFTLSSEEGWIGV